MELVRFAPVSIAERLRRGKGAIQSWFAASAPHLSPLDVQRRRAAVAVVAGLGSWLLRPLPPLRWFPGWLVGALVLWGALELAALAWRPQRWR
jgi:hypothetical protein